MNEVLPNKEIIDATQDAVLNAASSMVSILENTSQELNYHDAESFYLHGEFWIAIAFLIVMVALAKPVGKMAMKMLRNRRAKIANRIAEVVKLKEDAQKLLAEYERKFRGAKKEAADILAKSEKEIELIKKETLAKLETEMQQREKDAQDRLKAAERNAMNEITVSTVSVAVNVARKILEDSLDDKALDKLVDASIDRLKDIA